MKRLTAIWSRDVDPKRLAGRTKMIQAIQSEISANYLAEHLRLQNVLEMRSVRSIAGSLIQAIATLVSGSVPSLQCLLFCDRENHTRMIEQLRENPPDVLYCDGVRAFYFLKRMGQLREKMRIVVDLDDLMSRRMQALGTTDTPLSLGYLHDKLPAGLASALERGFISRAIARYEQAALTQVEDRLGKWADAVVLISQVEGNFLAARYRDRGCKAKVHAIPPQVTIVAPPQSYEEFSGFIFIGTDTLPQNKLTIQLILDLWRIVAPKAEIHIFGHMVSNWPDVTGVLFKGYVPDLGHVYAKDVVLFAPSLLRGGLKTKVAEAFAHGCAVVGNEISFEGLDIPGYPLQLESDEAIAELRRFPERYLPQMKAAAILGQEYLRRSVSIEQFQRNWREVLG